MAETPAIAPDYREQERLTLLAELGVLDTAPEPGFDALTDAAAAVTECPIALVSLVDGERQWFKARRGIDEKQTPRAWSFCSHAISEAALMEVRDAASDPRFRGNPLVTGAPGIRFYAGQPLTVDGMRIGTLCVIDTKPRELSASAQQALRKLGDAASAMLAERRGRVASFEQQRRLTEFALVSGDWLWETDSEHRVVWMSSAYASNPALPEPWTLGEPMTDGEVLDAGGAPVAPPMTLHRIFGEHHAFARAVVHSEAPSGPSYVSHSAVVRRDSQGRWCGYRGIARDMRPVVEAQEERRKAANVLSELSAQVPGLIFQLRLEATGKMSLPYVSEHIDDIYELTASDVVFDADPVIARWHPDDADRVMSSLQRSAADLTLWRETYRVMLPRRGERVLSGHAKPTRLEGGAVLWHGLLTDVTDEVNDAERLKALSIAQVAAEEAAQVRSEFMSRVSHELRTPLNAVLGFAQLLRLNGATQHPEDVDAAAKQILSAGTHLLSLVNDMLDLSSLDAGRLNLQLQPVAVDLLVRRCIALIEPHARQTGVIFESDLEPNLPTVLADVRALKQVLFNLLGNAIKFGRPPSAVRISARYESELEQVTLQVTDKGPGIAADKLALIFEPFTRLDDGAGAPSGSGLGLSISQKLILAMAGRIEVASEVEKGTTFTLRLAVDGRPEALAHQESVFDGLPETISTPQPGGAAVLYIEDEPVNALLMQGIFQTSTAPAHLIVALTGQDGLRQAVLLRPDLLLLDMNLPDMDGLEVLRCLKADLRTARIPVIAVSADAMPEQVRKALDAGFEAYWTKPLDIKEVRAELARRFANEDLSVERQLEQLVH